MTIDDSKLIYSSDRKAIIAKAREKGFTTYQIVVKLAQGTTYENTKPIADEWHEYLGISYGEFMKMARGRSW